MDTPVEDQKPQLPYQQSLSQSQHPQQSNDVPLGPVLKPREACTSCRSTKVKCRTVSDDSLPSDICARCTRLKIPCIYQQAKRGRKKRVPSEDDDTRLSMSSSSSKPAYASNKVQRLSPSHDSPQVDRDPTASSSSSQQHQPSAPLLLRPLQQQQQYTSFPQHSFEQPHPPSTMYYQPPNASNQQYQPSTSQGGSLFPQWSQEGMENPLAVPQSSHRYLPSPFGDNNNNNPPSGPLNPYFTPFPPPFQVSSGPPPRRPSDTQFQQAYSSTRSNPSSTPQSPYFPSPSHNLNSYSSSSIPLLTTRLPSSNNLASAPISPSAPQRPQSTQHQESFLRDTAPPPPSQSAPYDYPSVSSTTTSVSKLSSGSSTQRTVPSMFSIRGLLAEVDEESPKSRVAEPAPSLSVAEVLERKGVIDPEGKVVRLDGGPLEAGTGLDGEVGRGSKGKWDDPLFLKLLTEADVDELFECFHTRLNVFIDILDVRLHTPAYCRSSSAILFTAILCVASKIARPALYPRLLALSTEHLGRAFAEGICEIGLVQSLSILSFWKESSERGSWRRVGYAIRLAYELDIHLPHKRPLPEDTLSALKVLDRERTWFQLVCFDRTLYDQQNRPNMIQPEFTWEIEGWATSDHPEHYCLSDTMLAGSLSMMKVLDLAKTIRNSEDDSTRTMLMSIIRADLAKHKDKWLGLNAKYQLHPSCLTMLTFYYRLFTHEVDILQLSVVSSPFLTQLERRTEGGSSFGSLSTNSPGSEQVVAFSNCITSALAVLRYLVTDLPSFLVYAQDAVTYGSASSAVWLVKNINRMPALAAENVYTALREATVVCRSVTKDPRDASAYQARFFQSLLHVASSSRPPTRPSSHGNTPPTTLKALTSGRSDDFATAAPPVVAEGGGGVTPLIFDIAEANGPAGVDLTALDQQLEGDGGSGWPFSEYAQDQNFSIDEMFADLTAWFPASHGESLAATSGWGMASFGEGGHGGEV